MGRRLFLFSLFLVAFSSLLYPQASDSGRTRVLSAQQARYSEEWVRRGIIYEIYPRSFSPEGTFAGIEKRLTELKKLGVTILWLMPIHPVGVLHRKGTLGSPYSIQDYYAINPEFGTLDDFKRLVKQAHDEGFHLIIDLVANHTAWDSKLIKEHPEWFTKDSAGAIIAPNPGWTDVADLDYSKPGLRRSMIEMMKYWVRDVGIDGFRCDASEMVPTDFWEDSRTALDSIKPVMMLSEGSYPEHHLRAFDATYSWNIYHDIAPILKGKKPATVVDSILAREGAVFPRNTLRMRFSSNHDENAWDASDIEKFGTNGAKLAAVFVNTIPGIPLLYNGQEFGNTKRLGLFEKTSIDWKRDDEFRKLYVRLFDIRKNQPAFFGGEMIRIPTTNDKRVFAFARVSGQSKFIVVCNFDSSSFNGSINLSSPKLGIKNQITFTDVFSSRTATTRLLPSNSLSIEVPAVGFRLLQIEQEPPH